MALAAGRALLRNAPRSIWIVAAVLSIAPDFDVIGFAFGVDYGDLWGHRGLTHSLPFAVVVGALAALALRAQVSERGPRLAWIAVFFVGVMASHGFFDAMTDGGLGVAFFSPFDRTRYFLPFRPVHVSPIGIVAFFSSRGLRVLVTEIVWVWAPVLALLAIVRLVAAGIRRGAGP